MATQASPRDRGGKPCRLSARQFTAMIDQGIIPPEARVELLWGRLIEHPKRSPAHDFAVGALAEQLRKIELAPWFVREEKSVEIGPTSRVGPDIGLIRGPSDLYRLRAPGVADVGFLVEVADGTYPYDRGVKWRAYASKMVPIYWIVNLNTRQIEVYRDPQGRGKAASYREATSFDRGTEVPVLIEGREIGRIAIKDILPLNRSTSKMATVTRTSRDTVRFYRLSGDQCMAAVKSNIILDTARAELLGGVLINKRTKYPPHNFAVTRLGKFFHRTLPDPWFVTEEKSIKLGRFWYPEPDIAVVRGPDDLFQRRLPEAADLGFLIEAADSSYPIDRGKKWRRYATARVPIYWIVNLLQRRIEVYSNPAGWGRSASYRQVTMFGEGESVPVILDGQEHGQIAVSEILPTP